MFGVVYARIDDVADLKRGVRVTKSQLEDNGDYAVYQNSMKPLGYMDKYNCPADTTFIITAGTAGEIGYSYYDFWAADDCFYLDCIDSVRSRYIYYALLNNKDKIKTKVRKASVPRLSHLEVEKLVIPIPTLEEQDRIVSILDRFDTLCTDISEGIPAEIEARQKQYEYYRDKLLDFKELSE